MKKPMLLSNDEFDIESLDYTEMFQSKKRDGVRVEVSNQGLLNRSLKVLRNIKVQEYFKKTYENLPANVIIEGEVHGDGIPCRVIAGVCNSDAHDIPKGLKLYLFGVFDKEKTFTERMVLLNDICKSIQSDRHEIIEQVRVHSAKEVTDNYNKYIEEGFEGSVLMDGRKQYKEGRVTILQHIGFKIKPHAEIDLLILDVTERFLNLNESQTNELGRSFKRNTVDAKEGTGIAATFICQMPDGKTTTKVSLTGEEAFRREIWENKESYVGKYAVIKSMAYGTKDKLRHPRLVSIKDAVEK